MWISGAGPQSDSFEDLAMPLFDQLYNFASWLTQNREEAEDLVQETYAKALKGFSSSRWGPISGRGSIASCATRS
jgi:DNA-directed RNA polymerase specialized sigma24 family protein